MSRLFIGVQNARHFPLQYLLLFASRARGVNVTRSLPSRPSATGLLGACIAVRRFVGVLCVHFARIPPFPERTSAVLHCSYLRQVRTKGMVQWRSLFTNT